MDQQPMLKGHTQCMKGQETSVIMLFCEETNLSLTHEILRGTGQKPVWSSQQRPPILFFKRREGLPIKVGHLESSIHFKDIPPVSNCLKVNLLQSVGTEIVDISFVIYLADTGDKYFLLVPVHNYITIAVCVAWIRGLTSPNVVMR